MSKKKDNNLILVNVGNKKYYFTSAGKAGNFLGMQGPSVSWAIAHRNELTNNAGEKVTITLVDGSEIPYKLINN